MSEAVAGASYVVGFMFSEDRRSVLLIRKTRPKWQVGKLNGIGGRIESGETSIEAMRREFEEEVGIRHDDWKFYCTLGDARQWVIHFFYAYGPIWDAQALTDEYPEFYDVSALPSDTIPNLKWLIPMALSMEHESIEWFHIVEVAKEVVHV